MVILFNVASTKYHSSEEIRLSTKADHRAVAKFAKVVPGNAVDASAIFKLFTAGPHESYGEIAFKPYRRVYTVYLRVYHS
jgi:hypothetical protein